MQVLGEVPAQGEVTVPEELLAEAQGHVLVFYALKVALLKLIVFTRDLCVETDALWQVVQSDGLRQCEPLRLTVEALEGFPGLVDWRIGIVECPTPLVPPLIDGGLTRGIVVGVAIGEGEVRRVVGHGVPLGLQSPPHAGE